ncbi:MAG: hypothetical protein ABIN35_00165 [candidate division WOR-3 bacterium]
MNRKSHSGPTGPTGPIGPTGSDTITNSLQDSGPTGSLNILIGSTGQVSLINNLTNSLYIEPYVYDDLQLLPSVQLGGSSPPSLTAFMEIGSIHNYQLRFSRGNYISFYWSISSYMETSVSNQTSYPLLC